MAKGMGHGHGHGKGGFAKPKNMKKTLGALMGYVGRYKILLGMVVVFLLISAACTVGGSFLLKPATARILEGDFQGLAQVLVLMAGIYIAGALCSFAYARLMVHISQKTVYAIRRDLFEKMQSLPIKYFDKHTHGELMSRYTNDIDTISEMINNSIGSLISGALTFAGVMGMMFYLSWRLTLITVGVLVLMLVVVKQIGKRSRYYFAEQQKDIGAVNGYIEEMIEGQKVIQVFNHEQAAKEGFAAVNEAYRRSATAAQSFAGAMMPAMGNISHINYALTCCIGGLLAISGAFRLDTLVAFLNYTRQVSQPIAQISQQVNTVLAAIAGAERVFEVMEEPSEVNEGKVTLVNITGDENGNLVETDRRTLDWAWKKTDGTLVPLMGDVRFNHVVFGYNEEKVILRDISLFAKPGQKIAFVGSTGAGKTTITNLINRFYEIQSGDITYDGINVQEIEKSALRRSLGIVLQDTHLFTGTIADNIRYGKLDATDEEVVAAAKLANADGFIRHLPQGYETRLGGDGGNLSQGQRQLLAIARAAVADPPVLILDEATSSIDTRTEKLIEKGMDRLMAGRTVFVIAHRLSTVRNSQAIMVLEQGEIIERGSHDELLAEKGRYYQLYTGQAELS